MVELEENKKSYPVAPRAIFALVLAPVVAMLVAVAGVNANAGPTDAKVASVLILVVILFIVLGALACKACSGSKGEE